mgnify:CR=1 FL=1
MTKKGKFFIGLGVLLFAGVAAWAGGSASKHIAALTASGDSLSFVISVRGVGLAGMIVADPGLGVG